MKHLEDGQLRAALDGEQTEAERLHLLACEPCQQRLQQIEGQAQHVGQKLSFLASRQERPVPEARAALARFHHKLNVQKESSMFQRLFASRILRFGMATAVLMALVFSFPTTRAWAGEFLNLFRVQQVTVVSIDPSGLEQLNGNSTFGKQVGQLLSNSVTMTKKPVDPKVVADAAEASQAAGFAVRLPKDAPAGALRLTVQDSAAFTFQVDRAKAQALLDEAGRKDLVLPESIDGADISVDIPSGVQAAYGVCPVVNKETVEGDKGLMGRRYPDCILMTQIPSPTVNTPPNIDIKQIAEIGLEFTGMSREQAKEFSDSVDWTTSLVIPIPRNAATYKQVEVDGVTGTLIERPADDAPEFALIWVKDGIIYTIGGLGDRAEQAMQLANSLP